jgi:hypothetical protein
VIEKTDFRTVYSSLLRSISDIAHTKVTYQSENYLYNCSTATPMTRKGVLLDGNARITGPEVSRLPIKNARLLCFLRNDNARRPRPDAT